MKSARCRMEWSKPLTMMAGVVLTAWIAAPTSGMAADFYLKIDGVDGESTDAKHKGEIEIQSFSLGASQRGPGSAGGGLAAGKVSLQDFHFTTKVSKASPKLFLACATGEHMKRAVLTCRKAGGGQQEYLTYTLSDVLVSSYQTGGSPTATVPTDQFSLNFSKIEIEYRPQKADGSLDAPVKVGYDLKVGKTVAVAAGDPAAPEGAGDPAVAATDQAPVGALQGKPRLRPRIVIPTPQ